MQYAIEKGNNCDFQVSQDTGWAKKVIPVVHILHCTRVVTFFGPLGNV